MYTNTYATSIKYGAQLLRNYEKARVKFPWLQLEDDKYSLNAKRLSSQSGIRLSTSTERPFNKETMRKESSDSFVYSKTKSGAGELITKLFFAFSVCLLLTLLYCFFYHSFRDG